MNTVPPSPTPSSPGASLSRREGFLAVAGYLLLILFFSWPLALRMHREIPQSVQPVDPMHIMYGLVSGAQNLLHNPFQFFEATFFYPYSNTLSFLDQIFTLSLMAAPVYALTENVTLTYNITWIATFVIAGFGTYVLVRYLTGSRSAAFLAGILFAFHPYRFHSSGILHVVAIAWVPLALWSLHRWVHTRRPPYLFGFAALCLVQFLSSGYTGVFLLLATLLYLVVLIVMDRERILSVIWDERHLLAATTVVTFLVLIPFVMPSINNMRNDIGHTNRGLGDAILYSALVQDFVTPGEGSILHRVAPFRDVARQPLFPGVIAVGLGLLWLGKRGWRGHPYRAEFVFYGLLVVVAAVFSLGPAIDGEIRVPLPFILAYFILPGASFIRAPARFFVLAVLGIAVLAAGGWSRLGRRWSPPVARALKTVVPVLAVAELYLGPMVLFNPFGGEVPPVYDRLINTPRPVVLLELPMPADEAHERVQHIRYQLFSLYHGKRIVNGIGALVPPVTQSVRHDMQRFPDDASVETLQNLGVGMVFIHSRLYPPHELEPLQEAIQSREELNWVEDQDGVWVVEVVPLQSKG